MMQYYKGYLEECKFPISARPTAGAPTAGAVYPPGTGNPLRAGGMVRHPVFGVGQVQRCDGDDKVTIYFSSVGIKKLSLKYAKLTPVRKGENESY
jgi:hypothetical protein